MEYNKGNSASPVMIYLELKDGSLIVKNDQQEIIWQTEGNPTCYENPRSFLDFQEAYAYFLTHSISDRTPEEE